MNSTQSRYSWYSRFSGRFRMITSAYYPGPRGFRREGRREELKKRRENTSGSGRCESHYHATIAVNYITRSINKQPIATANQSTLCSKYSFSQFSDWRGKIKQLSIISLHSSFFSRLSSLFSLLSSLVSRLLSLFSLLSSLV